MSPAISSSAERCAAALVAQLLLSTVAAVACCSCQLTPQPAADLTHTGGGAARLASDAPARPAPGMPGGALPAEYGVQLAAYAPAELPSSAWTGQPNVWAAAGLGSQACPTCPACPPGAETAAVPPGPWRPPGISGPWPENEYLCDGGDQGAQAEVLRNWSVLGLDQEDTIAHYDTLDGRTEVEASNPVCLYARRFAAVRQVSGLLTHEVHDRLAGVSVPVLPSSQEQRGVPTTMLQPVEPGRYVGTKGLQVFRERRAANRWTVRKHWLSSTRRSAPRGLPADPRRHPR